MNKNTNFIKIKPLDDPINNCFVFSISALVNYVRKEYKLLLGGAWYFGFKEQTSEGCLGDRIETFNENELKRIVSDTYKVDYKWIESKDHTVVTNTIYDQISNGKPMALTINTYWCPWSPFYKKQINISIKNFVVINGIDEDRNIYCLNHITNNVEKILYDDFLNAYERCMLFSFDDKEALNINYDLEFKKLISRFQMHEKKKMFHDIRYFAEELKATDFENEYESIDNLDEAQIFKKLMQVEDGRYSFFKYFQYLKSKCNNYRLMELSQKLKEAAQMWGNIKGLLIRSAYIGSDKASMQKVYDKINIVADFEESIFEEICKID